MVRRKNVLATFQQSFIMLGVIAIQWVLFGYSLAFGPDAFHGLIGGLEWVGLKGVGLDPEPDYAPTIPHQLFMVYQLMFAIITPALISGAFAERMKFSAYLLFTLLWATFVYDPVAHWVWGTGGWIKQIGALDFAGGLVVHIISGVAALCCVLVMGKRKGLDTEDMHPHNLTMTALGTAILWFGWFGFNAGSALAAEHARRSPRSSTPTRRPAAATVSWCLIEALHKGKATVLGACSGAVAGLVAITPAAGFVTPMGAMAHRPDRAVRLLQRDPAEGQARLRRLARRLRRPRRRRHVRRPGGRHLRQGRDQRRSGNGAALRQPQPARQPGDLGRRRPSPTASPSPSSC